MDLKFHKYPEDPEEGIHKEAVGGEGDEMAGNEPSVPHQAPSTSEHGHAKRFKLHQDRIGSNIVSFMVYLAPLVYKKKSTEGFQSIPYVVALFSAMLWLYYGFLKTNGVMLITINTMGCAIEATYIAMYVVYAPRSAKIFTSKLLLLLNAGAYGLILLFTLMLVRGPRRVSIVGWVSAAFSVSVFAAPLSIMRLVIRTKSVEFMPFSLSLFLTFAAVIWFVYGLLLKDLFIAVPNVLGFMFGFAQMILYIIYKDVKKEQKLPEQAVGIKLGTLLILDQVNPTDKQLGPTEMPIELTESHV
ncbi:bidirectional sugar transporter SWEET9-like [Magnolia sinica]|uniref:bidirectional sugar transporter SWEET9-like n=1 Tax=Magnolia sinica TaxID=86752 RepID=UPI00265ACBD7|nr:bidirectional sugar transporter SWEET9-like [Magnolia sinica]